MLSVADCRKLLKNCSYTDEEIEEIRDSLDQLASILVEEYLKGKDKKK